MNRAFAECGVAQMYVDYGAAEAAAAAAAAAHAGMGSIKAMKPFGRPRGTLLGARQLGINYGFSRRFSIELGVEFVESMVLSERGFK